MLKTLVRLKELLEAKEKSEKKKERKVESKWVENQLKEMAKLKGKLILM